ncbi:pyridoxal phosphate-dependent decarboxylase family protein [Flavobacterium sp.]|uniref:pyridoxal phosphate-dependent decarboxylase family protein n=1 Tax=Flavobacterium sp. TaxID=239 RepID=UPI0039E70011
MHPSLQHDSDHIGHLLENIRQYAVHYLENLDAQPASRNLPEIDHSGLPANGLGLERTFQTFLDRHSDKMVASSGPRYWGYVTGGTTPAAIAGDWLASVFDQNTQAINNGGDISALVEIETINMLVQMLQLGEGFAGGFVTGATMANFTSLAVARQWAGRKQQYDIATEGFHSEIIVLSANPHSSALKSLAMLGMGSQSVVPVATIANREAVDTDDLIAKLEQYKGVPVIYIGSAGTVNTGDFDDMQAIRKLREQYNFWWHIDAAFGGFVACSPDHHHLVKGWESADSIALDGHKWLNVPYDSGIYLIRQQHAQLQFESFRNGNAPYLGSAENFNYLNMGPENSRRFRALPAWFTLMAYGSEGYRDIVASNIRNAQQFAELLEKSAAFKLAAPTLLNVVCFTLSEKPEQLPDLLEAIRNEGYFFVTPTVFKGQMALRAAFVNWRTTEHDIQLSIEKLINCYHKCIV